MPYSCSAAGGEVQVLPANDATYPILGNREEQAFAVCDRGRSHCETMMVHKFAIACGGRSVPWWRVANAASAFGPPLPAGLPHGYAPVSTMSGRFVLPSLAPASPAVARVSTQDLSPDSVIDRGDSAAPPVASWVTVIKADALPKSANSTALRVAGVLGSVLVLLLTASLVAAGRWRLPVFEAPGLVAFARAAYGRIAGNSGGNEAEHSLKHMLAAAMTRFAAVEWAVTSMPADLLLREVLRSELAQIEDRLRDVERQIGRRVTGKSQAIIRGALRDLDRVQRISQSAGHAGGNSAAGDSAIPKSIAEAYRVLGMNPDAAPAVVKKLVDALRVNWHPDHARNELDRRRREDRMKQINAAWDIIKDRRAAA